MLNAVAVSAITPTPEVITHYNVDLTVTLSIILAFSSIVVPAIIAIINSRKELKMKQLEIENRKYENNIIYKRAIFEKFLFEAGRAIGDPKYDHMETYSPSYYIALASAPENVRFYIKLVHDDLAACEFKKASTELAQASEEINNYLETASISIKQPKHKVDKPYCPD